VRLSEQESAEDSARYRRSVAALAALGYARVVGCLVLAAAMPGFVGKLMSAAFKFAYTGMFLATGACSSTAYAHCGANWSARRFEAHHRLRAGTFQSFAASRYAPEIQYGKVKERLMNVFGLWRAPTSPYLRDHQRLGDVIAAIQVMATYKFYKMEHASWADRIAADKL